MTKHIFISYSHKDQRWLEILRTYLKPLISDQDIFVWDDTQIRVGADWRVEIENMLATAKVAVLLVSQDFFASDFITKYELPVLLDMAQKGRVAIFWIAVHHSSYEQSVIERYQAVNDPHKPLSSLKGSQRRKELVAIAQEIARRAHHVQKEEPRILIPEFVSIPAGIFQMGSDDGPENARPAHTVTIDQPFEMSVSVVTQAEWKSVMGTEPWNDKQDVRQGDDYPAVNISWDAAEAYVRTLNALDKDYVYSLPTEAQWEYAARAGSDTKFSFGDDEKHLNVFGWYRENAAARGEAYAHRVRQKQPNAWGLYDMYGNVWEWVEDSSYDSSRLDLGRRATDKIVRGGGWDDDVSSASSAFRAFLEPRRPTAVIGVRLVRMPAHPSIQPKKPNGERAPFVFGPPITDPRSFFGRDQILKRIFDLLKRLPLHNIFIVGPRRSGKTSLLHHLRSITVTPPEQLRPGQRTDWLPNPSDYRWLMIDFQDARMGAREGLLKYILNGLGLSIPQPCTLDRFLDVMSAIDRPTIILFDEIGTALNRYPDLNDDLWESLRALGPQTGGRLGFILASHVSPTEIVRESNHSSPFFNIFGYRAMLGPLTEGEARSLIASSPIPFSAGDVEWILAQSQRWPILLQILCYQRLIAFELGEEETWRENALLQIAPFEDLLSIPS